VDTLRLAALELLQGIFQDSDTVSKVVRVELHGERLSGNGCFAEYAASIDTVGPILEHAGTYREAIPFPSGELGFAFDEIPIRPSR